MLIEIFADLICPWCFIGKRRLERAMETRGSSRFRLRWLPFQLNPDMPRDGMPRHEYLQAKFGSPERAEQVHNMMTETARKDGLLLRLDQISRTPNTIDAHRLVRYADRHGRGADIIEALFRAYFQQSRDIGQTNELVDIAEENGLNRLDSSRYLLSDADIMSVRTSDIAARRLGIHAVPCFVFDKRHAIAGAHDHETFLPLFDVTIMAAQQENSRSLSSLISVS
jgi:predicted DsbA family dithiol-disulfide isomerase